MKIAIGVDVGNYDTKTQNTVTPSSFRVSSVENNLTNECLKYNGAFYIPTKERNNQQDDKTENNYCIIMSLFGIAKEIMFQIREDYRKKHNGAEIPTEEMQKRISTFDELILGVGLPVGHFSSFSKKTLKCYQDNLEQGFEFNYCNYDFKMKLIDCSVFPQDYTAVAFNKAITVVSDFTEYYIIGIGGGTADIIPVEDGAPAVDKCKSMNYGTTYMYDYISSALQQETGRDMDYRSIETILKNGTTVIDETRKKRVKELSAEFIEKMIADFIHSGMKLSDYPCVFIGGGAIMMKPVLETNKSMVKAEFVMDVNANAKYYAKIAKSNAA